MRRLGSGAVLLSAGVAVGVVVSGGFPAGNGSAAVAAPPAVTITSPAPATPAASEPGFSSAEAAPTQTGTGTIPAEATPGETLEGTTAAIGEKARQAAERAASTDSGVITFGGQSLPDLIVAPPERTDGPLRLTVGLGDSITYRAGSWFRRVCGAGVLHTCRDAGIRGDTTAGMLERLDTDVLALKPQVVTVMAGTNDMNYGTSTAETMSNLDQLVTRIADSGAQVVLCTVAPRHRTPKQALALNTAIRKYAKAHRVPLLDTYTVLGTAQGRFKKGLTKDGVHPNAAGMAAMATYAEARLPKLLAAQS
ncbi:SGNH/GDSL hydrolase family protein [Kineosporia babensis]|uniref:GDSL-type esterase/lipase family protein n=1 Tax=Kineosporia babensis TaxID=499548 RepID=A0A9X1N6M6_9ACTN|nr:GDSL-type esterase/lipase family protein [Kineosporia babensis]